MRRLALATICVLFCTGPSLADDMASISCKQLARMKRDKIANVIAWVDGYWQGKHQQKMLDPDGITNAGKGLAKECRRHPKSSVLAVYGSVRGDD